MRKTRVECSGNSFVRIITKKLKLERLAGSRDESYNVASNGAYWQICVDYVIFFKHC
jgi:hypothetical protein